LTIASLLIDVAANTATLNTSVGQVNSQLESITSTASKVAGALGIAFSAGQVIAFGKQIIDFADRMQDLSEQTRIGVEQLQQLDYVAMGAGTDVETLADAMTKLTAKLVGGDPGAVKAFKDLGVNVTQFLSADPGERIFILADAMGKFADKNVLSHISFELFGKKFLELTPMMNSQLRELAKNAAFIPQDEIETLANFHDSLSQGARTLEVWAAKAFDAAQMAFLMNESQVELERQTRRLDESLNTFIDTQVKALDHFQKWNLQNKAVSMETVELKILTDQMNEKIHLSVKEHTDAAEAATKHAKALKKWMDDVHEAMASDQFQMLHKVTFQETIESSEKAGEALNKYMEIAFEVDEETRQMTRKNAQAWEEWEQNIHDDMARLEHTMIKHVATMTEIWGHFQADMRDSSVSMTDAIFNLYDAMAGKLTGLFDKTFGGQGFLSDLLNKGLSFLLGPAGPLAGLINMGIQKLGELAIAAAKKLWQGIQDIFGTDEEARLVNPARDKFLSQFGPSGTGPESGFGKLAAMLAELGSSSLFDALAHADKMGSFRSAAQAIVDLLKSHNIPAEMNFAKGGLVPMTGPAFLHQGERVQSTSEVSEFRQMLNELRGLRSDMQRSTELIPLMARDAALKAMA
jgi:hypothetical protein